MKIKKIILIVISSIISLLLLAVAGFLIWAVTGTYTTGATALRAMESGDKVHVEENRHISFIPEDDYTKGLIFYPGGLVEPTAYAPVLRLVAEKGYLAVITPMPLNLGILNTDAAESVFSEYPDVETWILAGHSLGGASAGIYAAENINKIKGVIFMDSYPPKSADLSSFDIKALSIFGTSDGIPNTPDFDIMRSFMPENTLYAPIEGASHAQFGDYGLQKGDVEPQISLEKQHEIVRDLILLFLQGL